MINTHSIYSLRYGLVAPSEIGQWAEDAGYKHIVLTDINSTTAALSFCMENQRNGRSSIVGLDVRNGIQQCYILIAKNNRGFHELNCFLSMHLHEQKDFPEQAPHLGNCWVVYPWGKEPKRLNENEYIGITPNN